MGDAMNKIKMHSYVLAACASVPRDSAKVKPEDSKRVHAVNIEPNPVAVDGSVGSSSRAPRGRYRAFVWVGGNSGVDPNSRQLGQLPRNGGYNDSPYQGNVPNRGFNGQHQDRYGYAEGRGAGGPNRYPNRYNRYSNRNANPVGAQRGGYGGANRGIYPDQPVANRGGRPGYAPPPRPGRRGGGRQDMMCFRCRGLGHFQRECQSPPSKRGRYGSNWGHLHAMSLPSHERGGPQHAKKVHDAVPLVLPTVPDVVHDPGMVIGKITEGGHGDPVCDAEFRVQRVAVQSAEAAKIWRPTGPTRLGLK
ncbi:hypothetical protein DPMN_009713 [Dreissena polymorpha]|uniref:CCHC-type domain-containing protein n=1 Tax=Dreissena polymorpha TaxID=45954 RepID=A0A9D4N2R0_DREPO|nr:hypothetical protein DPMN_009713 [Dreissena polymorpha]